MGMDNGKIERLLEAYKDYEDARFFIFSQIGYNNDFAKGDESEAIRSQYYASTNWTDEDGKLDESESIRFSIYKTIGCDDDSINDKFESIRSMTLHTFNFDDRFIDVIMNDPSENIPMQYVNYLVNNGKEVDPKVFVQCVHPNIRYQHGYVNEDMVKEYAKNDVAGELRMLYYHNNTSDVDAKNDDFWQIREIYYMNHLEDKDFISDDSVQLRKSIYRFNHYTDKEAILNDVSEVREAYYSFNNWRCEEALTDIDDVLKAKAENFREISQAIKFL